MKFSTGEKIFQVFLILFLSVLSLTMIYPFIHIASMSISTPAEAIREGLHFYPQEVSFYAWKKILAREEMWYGLGNSVFRTVLGTVLSLIFMSMCAYPLSRKYLPHRNFYTMFIVITMFFSGGLIPTYLLIKSLHLVDNRMVYILPGLIATFSMLILRNFFMSIPDELEDSAKIDGANDLRILFGIVLPLSKPILATLALWSAFGHWNAWFDAVLYIQDEHKLVLQTFLRRVAITAENVDVLGGGGADASIYYGEPIKAAIIIFTALPILMVYPFLQKYFTQGVMVGSLKG